MTEPHRPAEDGGDGEDDEGVESAGSDHPTPDWDPLAYDPVTDDLDGFRTPLQRVVDRTRGWVALAIVLGLVLPVGGVAIAEWVFGRDADRLVEELGPDAPLARAMLLVSTTGCQGQRSTGSAFALAGPGGPVVVTNRHVVADAASITVRPLDGGPARQVRGHRLAIDADVAILDLPSDAVPPALARGAEARAGQDVRVVGFPGGRPALSEGEVAEQRGGRMLLDLRIAGGSSGSPVLDVDGAVVGQVFARASDGRAVATPLSALTTAVRAAVPAPAC
ncbi:MAG: trypsin-like peptidase domain-containing protein [Nitriliruptoraceae bacterium]|nr:trypsin-like peptidase domain-containing protein [Nitriliruptoraceae bacterium]